MVSAIVTVNNNAIPTVGRRGQVVTAGSTVTVAVSNSAGVLTWSLSILNSDYFTYGNGNLTAVQNSLVQTGNSYATFTVPNLLAGKGSSFIIKSTVNAGTDTETSFQFGVYVIGNDGIPRFAGGQSDEWNITAGNADVLDMMVDSVGISLGAVGGDATGTTGSMTVVGLQGIPVSTGIPSDGYFLQFINGDFKWEGRPAGPFLTAGPTGSGANYTTTGSSDDAVINSALTHAAATGYCVKLLPGTYTITNQITVPAGTSLYGSGQSVTHVVTDVSFSSSSNHGAVVVLGNETTNVPIFLSADLVDGYNTIQVTTSSEYTNVTNESFLLLVSDGYVDNVDDQSGRHIGEYVKVQTVSANNFTIYGMSRNQYKVADNARLYRMSFAENVVIEGIDFTQKAATDTMINEAPAIGLIKAKDVVIRNCRFHDYDGQGIGVYHSVGVHITKNTITNLTDHTTNSVFGYGVIVGGATEAVTIEGNRFDRIRHALTCGPPGGLTGINNTTYGVARGISFVNNTVMHATNSAVDTHAQSEAVNITGNVMTNCGSYGVFTRGRGTHIMSNTIEWCGAGISVGIAPAVSGGSGEASLVSNNTIRFMKRNTRFTLSTGNETLSGLGIQVAPQTENVVMQGNVIEYCDYYGILLGGEGVKHCVIKDNTVVNCNLLNVSSVSGIGLTGTVNSALASITAVSGSTVTLTYPGTGFSNVVAPGQTIFITGAASSGNNGNFVISAVLSTSSLQYTNASGVAGDANNGAISFGVEGSTDNIIEGNVVINTPAAQFDLLTTNQGHAKYLILDNGVNNIGGITTGQGANPRNTFRNNYGFGMEVGLINNQNPLSFFNNNTDNTRALVVVNEDIPASIANPVIQHGTVGPGGGNGDNLTIQAQNTTDPAATIGGSVVIQGGTCSAVGGLPGEIAIWNGSTRLWHTYNTYGIVNIFAEVVDPIMGHDGVPDHVDFATTTLKIIAQSADGYAVTNTTGGDLLLVPGLKTPASGGSNGRVRLSDGSIDAVTVSTSEVKFAHPIHVLPSTAPSAPSDNGWIFYVDTGDGNKLKAIAHTGTIVVIGTP